MTVQKLHAVLKKAGHKKAHFNRSSMVRGWGNWTEGYDIRKGDIYFKIRHVFDHWKRFKSDEARNIYILTKIHKYAKDLVLAGVHCYVKDESIICQIN